jgi:diaminopimelate decarboxylase
MRVNLDSPTECEALLPLALELDWCLGVRCQTRQEIDPDHPRYPTQFGMPKEEAVPIIQRLVRAGARLETIHFHLRTNVESPSVYEAALREVEDVCKSAGFAPKYLDCGGGFPAPHVTSRRGLAYDRDFDRAELAQVYTRALTHFPSVRELWLENGRFLSARSGVLVMRILDIKERGPVRYVICDGGRTMNALISTWEKHELFAMPERGGPTRLTGVCGPTCMAFDQLALQALPARLQIGDCLVWMDAGAYHLPWETRFSHGTAAVWWHQDDQLSLARKPEEFDSWWGQWEQQF